MFKSYLKIAVRNILQNKLIASINVLGLSIGISAALITFLVVHYEFSFDTDLKDKELVFRLVSDIKSTGEIHYTQGVPNPLGEEVQKTFTGIELAAPIQYYNGSAKISALQLNNVGKNDFVGEEDIIFVDSSYLQLINYEWLAGTSKGALDEPNKVVLTLSRAKKYFPDLKISEIIGHEIVLDDTIHTEVRGVVNDLSGNTIFKNKVFISFMTLRNKDLNDTYQMDNWSLINSSSRLLVKLKKGISIEQIENQLKLVNNKFRNKNTSDSANYTLFKLQPFSEIRFNPVYGGVSSKQSLLGLIVIAGFILLLACFNFINLSTAHGAGRAKEIGIRKTMGSSRQQLILQLLFETFMLTSVAAVLSILLTPYLLQLFSQFIPNDLVFDLNSQPFVFLFLFVLVISVSFLAGLYPAFFLTRFKPVQVLRNQQFFSSSATQGAWIRKPLIISQFVIAQVFLMGTIIVSKQIYYSLNKDLGFTKEAIISIYTPPNISTNQTDKRYILAENLNRLTVVNKVSISGAAPSSGMSSSGEVVYNDGLKEQRTEVEYKYVDSSYIQLFAIKMLAGKNFQLPDSANEVIINETYCKILGFKNAEQAVGKMITWDDKPRPIIAVVADFAQGSTRNKIKPLAMVSMKAGQNSFYIKLKSEACKRHAIQATLASLEKEFKLIYPNDIFNYSFFDETIAQFYKQERNTSRLLIYASVISILISALGLLGLIMHTANQRKKEIGVRKLLGASIQQIFTLLAKEFVVLVLIAFVIATPIAWWGMFKWLQNYEDQTSIQWWVFALSGFIMFTFSVIILSLKIGQAANANPIKNLKTD